MVKIRRALHPPVTWVAEGIAGNTNKCISCALKNKKDCPRITLTKAHQQFLVASRCVFYEEKQT